MTGMALGENTGETGQLDALCGDEDEREDEDEEGKEEEYEDEEEEEKEEEKMRDWRRRMETSMVVRFRFQRISEVSNEASGVLPRKLSLISSFFFTFFFFSFIVFFLFTCRCSEPWTDLCSEGTKRTSTTCMILSRAQ